MRRRLLLSLAVTTAMLAVATTAVADDDLSDMLEDASDAEYHGMGVVMCSWGEDSAAATYEITHSADMSMVVGPDGSSIAYAGVTATESGGDWLGTEVTEWSAWSMSDRYTMGDTAEAGRLGRPATVVTVLEDGRPRVRMIIDDESGVPLMTEILDADGEVFRLAALVTFDPGPPDMPDDMDVEMMDTITPMPATTTLPSTVAGYRRADVYSAGGEAVHAFYTDGLFSFSVFEAPRSGRPGAFERATEFRVGGQAYRRIVTPTSVWVHWDAPDRSYVLVGDLPPDHLITVLEGLPAPGQRSIFVRMWRALFG